MNYKYEYVDCNICGSSDYQLISQKGQFDLPLNVVLCKKCGLGYLNPRWDEATYLKFYENEYDNYYRPNFKNEQQNINPIILRLKSSGLLPNNVGSILDIGSGAGKNLIDFKELYPGCSAFAIEPSLKAQDYLKNKGIKILAENVSSNWHKECSQEFDIIIMRHVLEHFLDPDEVLSKVRSVLSEDGLLYLAVPNCLTPRKPLQTHWFRVVHTYYFNKYSLANIAALNNLKIIGIFEGDHFSQGEIYSFLEKSENELKPDIQKEHYLKQRKVYKKKIEKENSFGYRTKSILRKVLRKLIR